MKTGFRLCDEHSGTIIIYSTTSAPFDKSECPICAEIKELKKEIVDLVIEKKELRNEIERLKNESV